MTETRKGRQATTKDIDLVVFVLADGARPDVLRALSASGQLPNITRHLLTDGSVYDGVTVLPSVTDVAYLPILSGQYPGTANIPGIRWVDKSQFGSGNLFLRGHRSYVGPTYARINDDLSDGLETLYELCPGSLAVRSSIHRGLSPGLSRFGRTSLPFMFFAHYLNRSDFIDRLALRALLGALNRLDENFPRFIFLPLLDVDTSSHAHGPHHVRTVGAYRRIDRVVGEIVDWLRGAGLWDRTHFLMSSDHGHSETRDHLNLSGLLSEMGYSVFEHPSVYRRRVDAAVMVSGNSLANVYMASEGKWQKPLTGRELEGEHQRLLTSLSLRAEVEWIAYRQHSGAIKIVSSAGMALLGMEGESYTYSFDGIDPLLLGLPHTRVHKADALSLTVETNFPDALEQIWQLFISQRTGDIVVTARPGYDLRSWRELPEHHSSHGALCREHMKVPILSNRPLSSDGPVRTVDLFPTIVKSLSLTPTKPHLGDSLW